MKLACICHIQGMDWSLQELYLWLNCRVTVLGDSAGWQCWVAALGGEVHSHCKAGSGSLAVGHPQGSPGLT